MAVRARFNPQTQQLEFLFFQNDMVCSTGPPTQQWHFRYTDQFDALEWPHQWHPFWFAPEFAFAPVIQIGQQLWLNARLVLGDRIADEPNNLEDNQVWKARDPLIDQEFVLKVCNVKYYTRMHPDAFPAFPIEPLRDSVAKMLREVRTLLYLQHPNIMAIAAYFNLGSAPGMNFPVHYHCTVMDLMDGSVEALQNAQHNQRMTEPQAFDWFIQIADAVDYLHNGIVGDPDWFVCHLAIRPANILHKTGADGQRIYKLTDFEESRGFTRTGHPEEDMLPFPPDIRLNIWTDTALLANLGHNLHARAMDIFSLGMSLMTNLIGVHNFVWRQDFLRYIYTHDNQIPAPIFEPLHDHNMTPEQLQVYPAVSPWIRRLIGRCMCPSHLRITIQDILPILPMAQQMMAMNQPQQG